MKFYKKIVLSAAVSLLYAGMAMAGNPDRIGQSGAMQLLINPWAASSGWGSVNMAGISGVESMSLNPAGLFHSARTEIGLSHSLYLSGTGISIDAAGLSQALGDNKNNALGISIMSFNFGNVDKTTEFQPETGAGTYSITMMNAALAFSHKFSDNIACGVSVRTIAEGTPDVKASGVSIDAGILYHTGFNDRIKFGVALRNIGPAMEYTGNALAVRATPQDYAYSLTLSGRAATFELPSVLNIAGSYDIITTDSAGQGNTLTVAGSYLANAFGNDQFGLGAQFKWLYYAALRAAYVYEQGIGSQETSSTIYSGWSFGAGLNLPFGKDKRKNLSVDYAFRLANSFSGTHTFGVKANF